MDEAPPEEGAYKVFARWPDHRLVHVDEHGRLRGIEAAAREYVAAHWAHDGSEAAKRRYAAALNALEAALGKNDPEHRGFEAAVTSTDT